jgi:hypothetical protein
MTFTVASNSFKDGDYLPSDFILSSDFLIWLRRTQQVGSSEVVGRSRGDKKFCRVLSENSIRTELA